MTKSAPSVNGKMTRMVKVERDQLLTRLEEVEPGLSKNPIVEQSNSFVFKNGEVYTFNEEVACRAKTGLNEDFTGAVVAAKLLEQLRKWKEEHVGISVSKNRMTIYGQNEECWLARDREILLPIESVERPKEWKPLHEDFTDAVGIVGECASKDQTLFTCTCIHLTPKWMEAFDNAQMTRYYLETGVSRAFLVRRDSIRHIPSYDFTEFAETKTWMHFRTKHGTVMSCRRFVAESSEFQDLTPILKTRGVTTVFPKALGSAAEKAEIFSKENQEDNLVLVEIRPGKLQITGEGVTGGYRGRKRLQYEGKPMKFRISPKLLVELLKRNTECEVSRKRVLRVNGGKFTFCACLEPT
jgi:hypothetical protein